MDCAPEIRCPFCNSVRIIKHGRTSTNNQRFRCRNCRKTWVQNKIETKIPDFGALTEAYLGGLSYRDLRSIYPNSPSRINQKIRKYLLDCANWEDFVSTRIRQSFHILGISMFCYVLCLDNEQCAFPRTTFFVTIQSL